jgi:hypothetical protein
MVIHVAWVTAICIVRETWIYAVKVIATYVGSETGTYAACGAQAKVI